LFLITISINKQFPIFNPPYHAEPLILPNIKKVNTDVFNAGTWFNNTKTIIADQKFKVDLEDLLKFSNIKIDRYKSFEQDRIGMLYEV